MKTHLRSILARILPQGPLTCCVSFCRRRPCKLPLAVGSFNFFAVFFSGLASRGFAATLVAANGQSGEQFGGYTSASGTAGLIGAGGGGAGSAYLFRNLDAASGTVTESVRLVPSDGVDGDVFGGNLNLSGRSGLVGSPNDSIGTRRVQGAAYLFRNLNTPTQPLIKS